MNNHKRNSLYLGIILFFIGLTGVLSLFTMDIPVSNEIAALLDEQFTPLQLRLITLINPLIMVIVAIVTGVLLHEKVGLDVPVIRAMIKKEKITNWKSILMYGIAGGIITGIMLVILSKLFLPVMPAEFVEIGENLQLTLATRFLYGGFAEEIMMRFGLMTFVVWLLYIISGSRRDWIYWIGLLAAAVLFAVAHFPMAFQAVEEPSALLLSYILIGNSLGGIIFGWLYWKKGLEAAFAAHIMAHVVMVVFA
jgi:membrane protease YdiL (CAAX protease family)